MKVDLTLDNPRIRELLWANIKRNKYWYLAYIVASFMLQSGLTNPILDIVQRNAYLTLQGVIVFMLLKALNDAQAIVKKEGLLKPNRLYDCSRNDEISRHLINEQDLESLSNERSSLFCPITYAMFTVPVRVLREQDITEDGCLKISNTGSVHRYELLPIIEYCSTKKKNPLNVDQELKLKYHLTREQLHDDTSLKFKAGDVVRDYSLEISINSFLQHRLDQAYPVKHLYRMSQNQQLSKLIQNAMTEENAAECVLNIGLKLIAKKGL